MACDEAWYVADSLYTCVSNEPMRSTLTAGHVVTCVACKSMALGVWFVAVINERLCGVWRLLRDAGGRTELF
jgi:hypothetical protein